MCETMCDCMDWSWNQLKTCELDYEPKKKHKTNWKHVQPISAACAITNLCECARESDIKCVTVDLKTEYTIYAANQRPNHLMPIR